MVQINVFVLISCEGDLTGAPVSRTASQTHRGFYAVTGGQQESSYYFGESLAPSSSEKRW